VASNNDYSSVIKAVSFTSRGFNASKKYYLSKLLTCCDILFFQEHWLAEDQSPCLNVVSPEHCAVGISGFDNSEVLRGRPYGGCAIFWRSSLSFTISTVVINSRRVCAVLLDSESMKLLCKCV